MSRRAPALRTRLTAVLAIWCVLQAWVWAPMADAAIDHDPILRAGCPEQAHVEASPDVHGVQGCLIQIAAHLVSGPSPAPVSAVWFAPMMTSLPLAATAVHDARFDTRLPPSRGPPQAL